MSLSSGPHGCPRNTFSQHSAPPAVPTPTSTAHHERAKAQGLGGEGVPCTVLAADPGPQGAMSPLPPHSASLLSCSRCCGPMWLRAP